MSDKEKNIRDFSKEVIITWLESNLLFLPADAIDQLKEAERQIKLEKLFAKAKALTEESKEIPNTLEGCLRFRENDKAWDRVHKQINKLMKEQDEAFERAISD